MRVPAPATLGRLGLPRFVQDVLLVNPSQAYPAEKSVDASSSLRSTELNGFAYHSLEMRSGSDVSPADRCLFTESQQASTNLFADSFSLQNINQTNGNE